MEKLDLFDVSKEYVAFLQSEETKLRGFTRVPNMEYEGREQKFLCGIVMRIHGVNYYVAASSYKKAQSENILIVFKNDRDPIKGSLRFNYMFPIPNEMVWQRCISSEPNPTRRIFLAKQLAFFNDNREAIAEKAERTYKRVLCQYSPSLTHNSCDFKLLEAKCLEYCNLHGLALPVPQHGEGER